MTIDPEPARLPRSGQDFFGNRVAYFAIETPHPALIVTAVSMVEIDGHGDGLPLFGGEPWEQARDAVGAAGRYGREASPSSSTPRSCSVGTFCRVRGARRSPRGGSSSRPSPISSHASTRLRVPAGLDVGEHHAGPRCSSSRQGVCQDFAHLAIGCLRSLGPRRRGT